MTNRQFLVVLSGIALAFSGFAYISIRGYLRGWYPKNDAHVGLRIILLGISIALSAALF